jgi:hypothetical protein
LAHASFTKKESSQLEVVEIGGHATTWAYKTSKGRVGQHALGARIRPGMPAGTTVLPLRGPFLQPDEISNLRRDRTATPPTGTNLCVRACVDTGWGWVAKLLRSMGLAAGQDGIASRLVDLGVVRFSFLFLIPPPFSLVFMSDLSPPHLSGASHDKRLFLSKISTRQKNTPFLFPSHASQKILSRGKNLPSISHCNYLTACPRFLLSMFSLCMGRGKLGAPGWLRLKVAHVCLSRLI